MAMVATAQSVFSGFLPQITGRLGPVRRVEQAVTPGADGGLTVFHLGAPGGEVGTAVTDGLRFRPLGTPHPVELCCTLLTGQERTAHRIVTRVGRMLVAGRAGAGADIGAGVGFGFGAVVRGDRSMGLGPAMAGVVCAGHPFTDADFDFVRDRDGRVLLQLMTLIPVTEREIALAANQGTEALFERWRRSIQGSGLDLADLTRPSAV